MIKFSDYRLLSDEELAKYELDAEEMAMMEDFRSGISSGDIKMLEGDDRYQSKDWMLITGGKKSATQESEVQEQAINDVVIKTTDLTKIKLKAKNRSMPYKMLISEILHDYAEDHFELKKAG